MQAVSPVRVPRAIRRERIETPAERTMNPAAHTGTGRQLLQRQPLPLRCRPDEVEVEAALFPPPRVLAPADDILRALLRCHYRWRDKSYGLPDLVRREIREVRTPVPVR